MPMTSREIVRRTICFESPERRPRDFIEPWGSDFAHVGMSPSPDARRDSGVDEWGAVWHNIGVCRLGEVQDAPLKSWDDFDKLNIPDVNDPARWENLTNVRAQVGEKFILGGGISLYERVHFLRGLENTWADIFEHPDELGRLIDVLVEMNLAAIDRYATLDVDGYYFCDDWGLQDRLMISPNTWREIWKPRYARVFKAAKDAGLAMFLHSCGYIVDILDDLIEIGLDAIHMDQQENMGLKLLGDRFRGRLTFYAPVDIQATMVRGSLDDIRAYCRQMIEHLSTPEGGLIPKVYADPAGAGHRDEAIEAMCEEFLRLE